MSIRTVVFIDSRVSSVQSSLTGLDAATTLTVVLNPEQNGLSQMTQALAGLSGLEAIHIVSHGNAGALQLGNLWLTDSNLGSNTASFTTLGQSLLPTGDVLLYGCNVGQGTAGQQFVAALAQATGADVAASTNATGQGGDWALELHTGSVTTAALAATGYTGQLASYVFAGNAAGYRVDTLNGVATVVDIDTSNGNTGSTALSGGNHTLVFADRSYSVQVPGGLMGEFRVNTTTAESQSAPAVTALSGGGYVVTWQSNGQDGSGWGIYAQRFDASGNAIGAETRVNTTTAIDQSAPAVTALSGGEYVVTWQSNGQDGSGWGIVAQRFDASGNALGAETRVNTTTAGSQYAPAVTALSGGGYVVTWQSEWQGGGTGGISAQRFDASGNAIGAETRVDRPTFAGQTAPDVTALSGGGYVVTYAGGYGISAQRFDASGNAIGAETRVNTTTAIDQSAPAVTALSSGGYVVTWQSYAQDGRGWDIYAQRFDASGNAMGAETRVNTTTAGYQTTPAVSALSGGGYVIAWQSSDGSSYGIVAQRFDASGNALGAETRVSGGTAPAITALSDGGYVVTWQSDDIYAQRFDADGLPVVLAITGTASDDALNGGAGIQHLFGEAGNDTLDGGAGGDRMVGGEGSDTYVVDDLGDVVQETGTTAGDIDTLRINRTYTLDNTLENLTLTGSASINGTGNISANLITGNSGNNTLTGLDGNDTLDGGAGADRLVGGTGDDVYRVDNTGDVVVEAANEGTDTAESTITYTLGITLEHLTLTGTTHINGTGNSQNNRITGNSGNNTLDGGIGADTLTGGLGDDLYRVDDTNDVVAEATNEGTDTVESTASTYNLTANTEHLTLTGTAHINGTGNSQNNRITGNSGNNTLTGLEGNDTLDGGIGADTLAGGLGDDLYRVDNTGDAVLEAANEGTDTVESTASAYTLAANTEHLTLTGTAHISGIGNSQDNRITGNSGHNTLDGGIGADTLTGGLGDDLYRVDNTGDAVMEATNQGTDTVESTASIFTLTANTEHLTLTGTANISGIGNSQNNRITGNSGNNTLDGGTGADTLTGGTGDDLYRVDNTGDVVTEATNEGTDTVESSVTYTLGTTLEHLTLTGSVHINGTGNSQNNRITGNSGNNTLDGGTGADTLAGGLGNDTYIVDNAGDVVTETSTLATEVDVVRSSVSWVLGSNIEQLWLTGDDAIDATGNALNNLLSGNIDENVLNGMGGIDTASYTDATAGVEVSLLLTDYQYTVGDGFDQLIGIENLTGSAFNDSLTGDAGGNWLEGGNGNDTLDGGVGNDVLVGGNGGDVMTGGAGNDWYVFTTGDRIVETGPATDWDTVRSSASYRLGDNLDRLVLSGSLNINGTGNALNNQIDANVGNNVLDGGAGADTVSYQYGVGSNTSGVTVSLAITSAQATGSSGSDTLRNVENLVGSNFNDRLTGNSGNNNLSGGAGNDSLAGGTGNDTLVGSDGKDTLTGGTGNDIFDFNALTELGLDSATRDVITDFAVGQDKIDLSTIDANASLAGDQAFALVTSFTTTAGQVRYSGGIVYLNTDADTAAEYAIQLIGVVPAALTAANFVL